MPRLASSAPQAVEDGEAVPPALEHLKLVEVGWRLPPGVTAIRAQMRWRVTPETEDGVSLDVGRCSIGWERFDGGKQAWTDLARLRAGAMAELPYGLVYGPDRADPSTGSRHIVAYDADRAVAYVTVNASAGRVFDELASGYVRPSHRRHGLGKLLMREALRRFPVSSIQGPVSAGGAAVAAQAALPVGACKSEAAARRALSKMSAGERHDAFLALLGFP